MSIESSKLLKELNNLEELFIGGTGLAKDGFVGLTKNYANLKRLSLVATDISTDIVTEILLGLDKLEWLDISYSGLTASDQEKIEKLKIFNKSIDIVCQGWEKHTDYIYSWNTFFLQCKNKYFNEVFKQWGIYIFLENGNLSNKINTLKNVY